jgi:Sulfotransferase domain
MKPDITPITQPSLWQSYKTLTASFRMMPDFIIIGGQKCGTTFLYRYLSEHPSIAAATRKELHFFDLNVDKGMAWYRSHFPLKVYARLFEARHQQRLFTGEASPAYLFYPHVPRRIAELLPPVKLIALLRNPIDRAYSHYKHNVRRKRESLSFEEAIAQEAQRLSDPNKQPFDYHHYSYLKRGIYAEQLGVWLEVFPKEQLLILRSEDLFEKPQRVFAQVQAFIGVPHWELPADYQVPNPSSGSLMRTDARLKLAAYFRPHNQALTDLLGRDFEWDME